MVAPNHASLCRVGPQRTQAVTSSFGGPDRLWSGWPETGLGRSRRSVADCIPTPPEVEVTKGAAAVLVFVSWVVGISNCNAAAPCRR